MSSRRQEVWGSPIAHSQSPQLHLAAYRQLGLDWEYRRVEVAAENLEASFHALDSAVAGLSLTMPLKEGILELVSDRRGPVDLLHAANTVVRAEDHWWLDNTDWWGVAQVLERNGGVTGKTVWLLGAGATARSVLFALSKLAPAEVVLVVRDESRARLSSVLADTLALSHRILRFDQIDSAPRPDWVMSTIPGGRVEGMELLADLAEGSTCFDAAYDPWPTPLAALWAARDRPILSGLEMLSYQALAQVRCFVGGDSQMPLPDEGNVIRAMREAVGLDTGLWNL